MLCCGAGASANILSDDAVLCVVIANIGESAVTSLWLMTTGERVLPRIHLSVLVPILIFSAPLLLSGLIGIANELIDRQMIVRLMPQDVSEAELGIYGAVTKVGVVMMLFTQMYRYAAEPFFLGKFDKSDFKRTNAEALKYFMIVSVAIFLMVTLFTDFFALLIGRDFREGIYILPVVLCANVLAGVVVNLSFWYKQSGQTKFAIIITLCGLLGSIAYIPLVPHLGGYGAAIARLICEAIMVVVSVWLNRKFFPTPDNLVRMGEYVVLGAVSFGVSRLLEGGADVGRHGGRAGMLLSVGA